MTRAGGRLPGGVNKRRVTLLDIAKEAGVHVTTVGGLAVEIWAGELQHNKHGATEIPMTTYVEGTWFDGKSCPQR